MLTASLIFVVAGAPSGGVKVAKAVYISVADAAQEYERNVDG